MSPEASPDPGMSEDVRKDGIPSFDGSPEKLTRFREEALQYMFTLEHHKRYLAGPRLAAQLTGTARTVVRRKLAQDPQWLAHPRGAYVLVDFLEQAIEKPSLVLASQHIQKFFYGMRRRKGETMVAWTNRHGEALWEASRALQRVQKDSKDADGSSKGESYTGRARRNSFDPQPWSQTRNEMYRSGGPLFDDNGRLREDDDEDAHDAGEESRPWRDDEGASQWSWRQSDWRDWNWDSWKSEEYMPPPSWETEVKDFLPDYLVGFLLLHRSGLDAHERANILAAIRGEFSVASVEKALKEQWTEDDLQRRDRIKNTANVATDHMEDDDDTALNSFEEVPDEHYEPEAFAAYMEEQGIIDSALEAIKEKRRTLKEARWRQSQVKKSRQFYSTNRSSSSSFRRDGPPRDMRASVEKCLKCGGPHSSHMCLVKKQQAHVSEESAEIVFSAMEEGLATDATTGHEALQSSDLTARLSSGKGIIDCGATSTLGSIAAVESIMVNNMKRMGKDRVTVDPDTQPTFRFGNNGTTNCLSTVKLGVDMGEKSGSLEIHVHDVPDQPVLISLKALKKLGAIIDFGRNEVVYRKVCDKSVVPLEVAGNGHLLMPLNGNLLEGAHKRQTSLQSLSSE